MIIPISSSRADGSTRSQRQRCLPPTTGRPTPSAIATGAVRGRILRQYPRASEAAIPSEVERGGAPRAAIRLVTVSRGAGMARPQVQRWDGVLQKRWNGALRRAAHVRAVPEREPGRLARPPGCEVRGPRSAVSPVPRMAEKTDGRTLSCLLNADTCVILFDLSPAASAFHPLQSPAEGLRPNALDRGCC